MEDKPQYGGGTVPQQESYTPTPLLYVGSKIIKGFPMSEMSFMASQDRPTEIDQEDRPGYQVTYPDGYVSWSPKDTFENAYRLITPGELALIEA